MKGRGSVAFWVAVLFMAPVLLAMWLRFGPGDWQLEMGNHGELIQPPVRLDSVEEVRRQSGYWLMIQLVPQQCEAECEMLSDTLRRVRVALGKDAHRLRRLRVLPDSSLWRVLETKTRGVMTGTVYLVDPRSFLMMRYPPGFDANGLLDDLERLLRYSKVGVQ